MYGLPKNFPYERLKGEVLTSVSFGEHDLILRFGDNLTITCESALGVDGETYVDFSLAAPKVLSLLGKTVVGALSPNEDDLEISFSSGVILKFIDDSDLYESYIVDVGPTKIVV